VFSNYYIELWINIDHQNSRKNNYNKYQNYFFASKSFKIYRIKTGGSATNDDIRIGYSMDPCTTADAQTTGTCNPGTYNSEAYYECVTIAPTIFTKNTWHNVIMYADKTQKVTIWLDYQIQYSTTNTCVYFFDESIGNIIYSTKYTKGNSAKEGLDWGSFTTRNLRIWKNDLETDDNTKTIDTIRYQSYV